MPKLTPWFSPGNKPVRVGVYEMEDLPYAYHYWDGCAWFNPAKTPNKCINEFLRNRYECSLYVDSHRWRGLTKEAK